MLALGANTDGKTYALPLSQNYMAIFYNGDIFEQVGITELPTTWDELMAVCDKLVAAGITPFAFGDKDPGRVGHCFQALSQATYPRRSIISSRSLTAKRKIADNAEPSARSASG